MSDFRATAEYLLRQKVTVSTPNADRSALVALGTVRGHIYPYRRKTRDGERELQNGMKAGSPTHTALLNAPDLKKLLPTPWSSAFRLSLNGIDYEPLEPPRDVGGQGEVWEVNCVARY